MKKLLIPFFTVLALVLGFAVVTAQNATPVATEQYPLVGTWLLDADAEDLSNAPEVILVTADGGYISVNAEGVTTLGVWEATGERSAVVTLTSTRVDESGATEGTYVTRASVEVDVSGDTLTASYTTEVVEPDGTGTGEFGPTSATATRLAPEPMGTPVADTPEG